MASTRSFSVVLLCAGLAVAIGSWTVARHRRTTQTNEEVGELLVAAAEKRINEIEYAEPIVGEGRWPIHFGHAWRRENTGIGPECFSLARQEYEAAAANGDSFSCAKLALYSFSGPDGKLNPKEGVRLLKSALGARNPAVHVLRGAFPRAVQSLFDEAPAPESPVVGAYSRGISNLYLENNESAIRELRFAADSGLAVAIVELTALYAEGEYDPPDISSQNLFGFLATQLGYRCLSRHPAQPLERAAAKSAVATISDAAVWWNPAANLAIARNVSLIGRESGEHQYDIGFRCAEVAASLGVKDAYFFLGLLSHKVRDDEKAMWWFKCGGAKGDVRCAAAQELMQRNGEGRDEAFRRAANKNGMHYLTAPSSPAPRGYDTSPTPLDMELPPLPRAAKTNDQGQLAVVKFIVAPTGDVTSIKVSNCPSRTTEAVLRRSALRWRYKPAVAHGKPIAAPVEVAILENTPK